jgi:hypothetical protein
MRGVLLRKTDESNGPTGRRNGVIAMPDPHKTLYLLFLALIIPHAIFTVQLIVAKQRGVVLLLVTGAACLVLSILAPMDSAPDGIFVGLNALAVLLSMSGALIGTARSTGFNRQLGMSSVLFATLLGVLWFVPWSELQYHKQ